jgi:DNA-nicking Smr family endonuclease
MSDTGEPHRRRRRRELSAEEHALWRGIARSVRPLRKHARCDTEDGAPVVAALEGAAAKAKAHKAVVSQRPVRPSAPPPLAPLARREKQQLARGRVEIDARIDLHGMTQAEAHMRLVRFLRRAQSDGAKFVLVITGKGARSGDPERGVLRRQVPLWLQLPDLRDAVVGFEEAHVAHGGEGALYVRLRRAKG